MKIIYADKHTLHNPSHEIMRGQILDCYEKPDRALNILDSLASADFKNVLRPLPHPLSHIERIHTAPYIEFLKTAAMEWQSEGYAGDVFATNFNIQHKIATPSKSIEGKAGYFLSDLSVSLTTGTWEALAQSVDAALTALDHVMDGEQSAFALCRPPGHHATASTAGGYCFLNNAAIAAQTYLDKGFSKVAILDVDYHHGNGTQEIFYQRNDVLFCSLHADPTYEFPYFVGHASETGEKEGIGFNRNYPMPSGTNWAPYSEALEDALNHINKYGADLLIVSLGVDTFKADPISSFSLETSDFYKMGQSISKLAMPALFVMEGGYAVEDIGSNVLNSLQGYLNR
ncbi:MAG: acetylpolyamine amidohydrolase [Micavibrio aeruginosavorus]|uniref:Acetylpolyamine amidohydrolase n=1 Tax=Micavibrio aeruginosavorus TaxID=349221 RepID=A0A2W5PVA3_9BACT|nr:MAG: acetylpolyamine amidohydrolase [Micavibrio aeruginosavorus]